MLVVFFNSMESETSAWTPGARCQSVLEKGARVHTVVCIVMAAALLPIGAAAVLPIETAAVLPIEAAAFLPIEAAAVLPIEAAAVLPIEEHAVWHLGCSPRAAHVYKVVLQTWGTA